MIQRRVLTTALLVMSLVLGGVSCNKDPEQAKQDHLQRGNEYFAEGKLEEASIEYRNAIQIDSQFGEALYRFGLCEFERKSLDNALPALRSAVTLQPDNHDAKLKLVEALLIAYQVNPRWSEEVIDAAKPLIEALRSADVEPYQTLRLSALVSLAEERLEDALEDLREAHELRPDQPDTVILLTRALISAGKGDEAEKLAREFVEDHDSPGPLYDTLYTYYLFQQRFSDALEILKDKVDSHPDEALPHLQLATHYARTQQQDQMRGVLQEVVDNPERFPAGRMHVGDFYTSLRQWDEAIPLYEAGAIEDQERRGEYRRRIMGALLAQGKMEEARQVLEQALAENPEDRDTRALKAMLLAASGERESMDAAVVEWKKLTDEAPDNAGYWYNLGLALRATGDLEGAQQSFQQSIAKNWNLVPPRVAMIEIRLRNGQFSDALAQAEEALKLSPEHRQVRLVRAMSLTALEKYDEAGVELERLLQENPGDAEVEYQLTQLQTKQGKYDEAEKTLAARYEAGAEDPRIITGLADVYNMAQNKSEKARSLLASELEERPDSVTIRRRAAEAALELGDTAFALDQYRYLADQYPSSAQTQADLAKVYIRTGQFREALDCAERAVELAPDTAETHLLVAIILERLDRGAEAEQRYRSVLKANPNNTAALNNLAFLLAESGELLDEALVLAQRAVSLSEDDANLADTLGWVYLKRNMSGEALRIFDRLVANHPDNATYRYHLGAALVKTGKIERARPELEAALSKGLSAAEETEIRALLTQRK